MHVGQSKSTSSPQPSPILQQFWRPHRFAIKAAAAPGNIQQEHRPRLATFASAQALAICSLPHTKQNRKCLRIRH
jgi:hypothetical protein